MENHFFQKLADLLTTYCLEVKPGDVVGILSDTAALPLIAAFYRAALRAGAFVIPRLGDSTLDEILLREGSLDQIRYLAPGVLPEIDTVTKILNIFSETNPRQFTTVDPERLALKYQALEPMRDRLFQRTAEGALQWCITQYPSDGYAQQANMSRMEYEDFVFRACLLDQADPAEAWRRQGREQQRVLEFLSTCRHIRIVAPGTDLAYSCEGRTWINCEGKRNMPDGEVYTGPIEDSVQGQITFGFPASYSGTVVEGAVLQFVDGKVEQASARQGLAFLNQMLDLDAGARYVGEVAFGLNYGIDRAIGHALFDEKIGGTMHLAVGRSLPDSGGINQSALHWDLVCDLREGEVYADGTLCYQNGRFLTS